jgi:hypothetical protein
LLFLYFLSRFSAKGNKKKEKKKKKGQATEKDMTDNVADPDTYGYDTDSIDEPEDDRDFYAGRRDTSAIIPARQLDADWLADFAQHVRAYLESNRVDSRGECVFCGATHNGQCLKSAQKIKAVIKAACTELRPENNPERL